MKVFAVIGYTKSGKTTTIESIIKELRHRKYSVGSIKDIHFEEFHIDTVGTNTHRHKEAGSQLVTARGLNETDILYQRKLDIYEIATHYDYDYLILEGYREANVPKIVAAASLEDLDDDLSDSTFAISGRIAAELDAYCGVPAINALENVSDLVDLIEIKTFELLPDFDQKCCGACGYSCKELCGLIVQGEKARSDCVLSMASIALTINGRKIDMVPFVQNLLRNAVIGVVSELDGYQKNARITVELGVDYRIPTARDANEA